MMASLSVAEEPAENPPSKVAGERKSSSAETSVHACGDVNVEGEAVEQVTTPFQRLASGEELQSCEIDDRAVRGVLAGNPLGIVEREVAGVAGIFSVAWKILRLRRGRGIDGENDDRRSRGRCLRLPEKRRT
jgi:hypothetical protein